MTPARSSGCRKQSNLGFLLVNLVLSGGRGNRAIFPPGANSCSTFERYRQHRHFSGSFNSGTAAQRDNRYIATTAVGATATTTPCSSYTAGDLTTGSLPLDQFGARRRSCRCTPFATPGRISYLPAAAVLRPGRRAEQRRSVHPAAIAYLRQRESRPVHLNAVPYINGAGQADAGGDDRCARPPDRHDNGAVLSPVRCCEFELNDFSLSAGARCAKLRLPIRGLRPVGSQQRRAMQRLE